MDRSCYRCGAVDPFPVLVRIIECNSGPSAGVYACPLCARLDHKDHSRMCVVCAAGEFCKTNMEMRAAMFDARHQRIAGYNRD